MNNNMITKSEKREKLVKNHRKMIINNRSIFTLLRIKKDKNEKYLKRNKIRISKSH